MEMKLMAKKVKKKIAKQVSRRIIKKSTLKTKGASSGKVVLLSGGNPQIPKGEGEAPIKAYLQAMPGWKKRVGVLVDSLVVRAVPKVEKAVKWNSPFYGMKDKGFFLSFHCFNKYVKVTFLNGGSLKPLPPGESAYKRVRYLDIYERDKVDQAQFMNWVKQASRLTGERL